MSNKNQSNNATGSQAGTSSRVPASGTVPSKYTIYHDIWGGRDNFQDNHGLPRTPEGYKEGNQILDAFQKQDRAVAEAKKTSQKGGK